MFIRYFLFVSLSVALIDIIIKQIVRSNQIHTKGHFLDITFIMNRGSLFSLFDSIHFINILFILISILAIIVLVWYVRSQKDHFFVLSLGLLAGGVLGNVFDRIFFGAVIDWINFHFWPVFNIADSAIFCGILLAIIVVVREEYTLLIKNKKANKK